MNWKGIKYLAFWTSLLVAGVFLVSSVRLEKLDILKNESFTIRKAYDVGEGGSSVVDFSIGENKEIEYTYTLGQTYLYPYAGIELVGNKGFDLRGRDFIDFTIESDESKTIIASIQFVHADTLRLEIRSDIVVSPGVNTVRTPLSSYNFPTWYLKGKGLQGDFVDQVTIGEITGIRLGHNIHQKRGVEDKVKILGISAGNDNTPTIWVAVIIVIIGFLIDFLYSKLKNVKVVITYEPADVKAPEIEKIEKREVDEILSYINQHYKDSGLTLKEIRKNVKIPENKISKLIKKEFQISYKDYINQLRIEEAKRIFRETPDIHVSEVCYAVGFGGATTFNKVFKDKTGLTPTEYIQSLNAN